MLVNIATPLFSLVWKFMFSVGIGQLLTRAAVIFLLFLVAVLLSWLSFKIHCINSPCIE